jgi:hypothetical protein
VVQRGGVEVGDVGKSNMVVWVAVWRESGRAGDVGLELLTNDG